MKLSFSPLLLLALMFLLFASPSSLNVEATPMVGVYFYVWYGEGLGGRHWNDSVPATVVDKPIYGYYSSLDPRVVRSQLR